MDKLYFNFLESIEIDLGPGFSSLKKHVLFSIQAKKQPWYNSTLASRRKRLTAHFEDLEQCYFSTRMTRVSGEFLLLGVQLPASFTFHSPTLQESFTFKREALRSLCFFPAWVCCCTYAGIQVILCRFFLTNF